MLSAYNYIIVDNRFFEHMLFIGNSVTIGFQLIFISAAAQAGVSLPGLQNQSKGIEIGLKP